MSLAAASLPLDIKCVNWVTKALFWAFGAMTLVSLGLWLAQHPAWTVGRITVVGEVAHQNEVTFRSHIASQLRGSFLTLDLQQVKTVSKPALMAYSGIACTRSRKVTPGCI